MKTQILDLIRSTKGRFFSVTFTKADGTLRKACAQHKNLGALKGGESTHKNSNSIPFYDVNKKAYRSFNVDRLSEIKCGGSVLFKRG